MRTWILKPGDPSNLILAVDARFDSSDYFNDQIWELVVGRGEPPSLSLQTSFGLRARNLRLFPRFGEDERRESDPANFQSAITVQRYFPNYIQLIFSPLPELETVFEVWIPASQVITGRLTLKNTSPHPRQIQLEWVAVLVPLDQGQRMLPTEMEFGTILSGLSGGVAPVLFLKGGSYASSSPFPSLTNLIDIPSQDSCQSSWALAALSDATDSFKLARDTTNHQWDPRITFIERVNEREFIEIHTGNPLWDRAFDFTQFVAYSLFLRATSVFPEPSFVVTRRPDQGYFLSEDGSDLPPSWKGQTPLEAYYLARLILPAAPHLAKGILMNFFATQAETGFIDWRAGIVSQRSQLMATPLLTSLAWQIYQFTEELSFLESVFHRLYQFLMFWFSPQQDRDGDGLPEWSHPLQTGFENHPLFTNLLSNTAGLDISTVEGPDLCSLLYRECQLLIKIAQLLDQNELIPAIQAKSNPLKTAVEASWNNQDHMYHYWDRDTHTTEMGNLIGERIGSGDLPIFKTLPRPARLLIRVETNSSFPRRLQIFIHGQGPSGVHRIERITTQKFTWHHGRGNATSDRVYISLEHADCLDFQAEDRVTISLADHSRLDNSLLLPIWAGIPNTERVRILIDDILLNPNNFWAPSGIRICPGSMDSKQDNPFQEVYLPWNILIGEGLLAYGFRAEAAELVTRIMQAVSRSLSQHGCFFDRYHAETGEGMGERNALPGLAPLSLFLDTLGVRIIHPRRIFLEGNNPFPWPVTVKYRGTTIYRQRDKTTLIFSDGQTTTVNDPSPYLVVSD